MEPTQLRNDADERERAAPPEQAAIEKPPAWELIELGRYRPRRIRGSLLGRELG
jgi:hypothetical protein